jgi:uncharacterized protein (TIGR02145 family)
MACILAAVSCKDEDEDTKVAYLNGSLTFELKEFILPGEIVKMTPKGISHPDNKGIGYYWKVTPTMTKYDTVRLENGLDKLGNESDGSFTHKFSDTLQTYTVYCYGFAADYTSSSASNFTTVVSPGPEKSITGSGISVDNDKFITANGQKYYYTTIGKLDWFKQNLAYTETGIPFRNADAMDGVFGKYYSYKDAVNACPDGWRLPSDAEWASLAKTYLNDETDYAEKNIPDIASKVVTDAYFNGVKMWEYWPSVGKPTNESGLSLIPTGYATLGEADKNGKYPTATFTGVYQYAICWTADKADEDMAYYRYIYYDQPAMMIGKADTETFAAAVRCVRDVE